MVRFYYKDPSRTGTLWKGEGGDDAAKEEIHAPRLLAIPLWLLDRIKQEGRALMPYEILEIITDHIGEDTTAYAEAWTTIADWCLLAGQASTTGDSFVSFSIEAITEVEDEYLGRWLEQRLDTTMGPRPQGGAPLSREQRGGCWDLGRGEILPQTLGKGSHLG